MNSGADDDQAFLDRTLERALFDLEEQRPVSTEGLLDGRDHLRNEVEEIVRLARSVIDGRAATSRLGLPGYEIVRELGHGGMGVVYLARQERLGSRLVALKVLPPSLALSRHARERFRLEVNAVAQLRHPNIVLIHDLVEGPEVLAFAMDWVNGKSLAEIIDALARGVGVPTIEALRSTIGAAPGALEASSTVTLFMCRLGVAIGRALAAVHRAGLLHRDVKPSNVLVRRDGVPFLSDFGLARETDGPKNSQSGAVIGTPAYAAPEQLRGERHVDARTDVYALGATLYHALALRPPVVARTPAEMLRLIEAGAAPPLRTHAPHVSVDLETIVSKAMAPEPERRYAGADELADDIERLLALEPIRARPPSAAYRLRIFVRRHSSAVISATIGSLALVAATAVSLASARTARVERDRASDALARESSALAVVNTAAKRHEEFAWLLQQIVTGANPDAVGRARMTVREAIEQAERRHFVEQRQLDSDVESAVRMQLAQLYIDVGLLESAAPHVERALELRSSLYGESSNEYLQTLHFLGRVYHKQERPDLALGVHDRIVAERRRRPRDEAHYLAQSLCSQAISLRRLARLPEAEIAFREAMELYAWRIDPEDENVGIVAINLARLLSVQGRHAEALDLGMRSVAILEKFHLGPNHVGVTEAQYQLGLILTRAGDVEGGESMAREALAIEQSLVNGPRRQRADKLRDFVTFLVEEARLDEALELQREMVEILRAFEPETSPAIIAEEEALCRVLRLKGDWMGAEARCREVIARGGDALATSGIWRELGAALCVGRHFEEAEEALSRAWQSGRDGTPGADLVRQETATWLARACEGLASRRPGAGYEEKATRWRRVSSR